MSKNHSGRPLNVNHHSKNKIQPRTEAGRKEVPFWGESRKPGKGK